MVRDAEANAEVDVKRRQIIEAKNEIDSLVYSTQKSLDEHSEKIDTNIKAEVEKAIAEAKEVKEDNNLDVMKQKLDALNRASLKVGQVMYGQQQQEPSADGASGDGE